MPQPISILNLYPTFSTRDDYTAKTGKPCPEWTPTKHPKAWEDLNAKKVFSVNGVDWTLYVRTFSAFDAEGNVVWEQVAMPVEEAKSVNIPPMGEGQTNVPGADQTPVPCPMRLPTDGESIRPGFGNVPVVWTAAELDGLVKSGPFTQMDREQLGRVEAKCDIIIAKLGG